MYKSAANGISAPIKILRFSSNWTVVFTLFCTWFAATVITAVHILICETWLAVPLFQRRRPENLKPRRVLWTF